MFIKGNFFSDLEIQLFYYKGDLSTPTLVHGGLRTHNLLASSPVFYQNYAVMLTGQRTVSKTAYLRFWSPPCPIKKYTHPNKI
jgi:hypothetical protein